MEYRCHFFTWQIHSSDAPRLQSTSQMLFHPTSTIIIPSSFDSMSDYGFCCESDGCKMPNKKVKFCHVCMDCSWFLHVICGVTTDDDKLLCHQCSIGCQAGPIIFEPCPKVEEQMGDSSNFQNIPNDTEEQTGASSNLQYTPTTEKKRDPPLNFKILLVFHITPETQV